jgi:hypothetical protein
MTEYAMRIWLPTVALAALGLALGGFGWSQYNDDGPFPWYVIPGMLLAVVSAGVLIAALCWALGWAIWRFARRRPSVGPPH